MNINLLKIEQYIFDYYNLSSIEKVEFLGKSENLPFRVETTEGKKYLFKQHTNSKENIESELIWLEDLHNNANLVVQTPVKNKQNEYVTVIFDEESRQETYWTLQKWVEGDLLVDDPSEEEIEKLAQLIVKLHNHSSHWQVPQTFDRPKYYEESLLKSFQQLKETMPHGSISESDFEMLEKTIGKIKESLNSLEKNRQNWGVIHADLHESNYVFHEGEPAPLDFSSCGYGFYLYDLAETFLHLVPDNRKKLIFYYQKERSLPVRYEEALEACFIWAIIGNFAFLSKDKDEHEGIIRTVPIFIEKYCKRLLEGERFLLI